jgi:hypothetical protein
MTKNGFGKTITALVKPSDGTSQQTSSQSRAEPSYFGLELFKPKSFKNQAFQA